MIAQARVAAAIPADPSDDGPVAVSAADLRAVLDATIHGTFGVGRSSPLNIWDRHPDGDTHWAMGTNPARAAELVRLANLGLQARAALSHHLDAGTDPCQDRGVDWPCDVAIVLGEPE